LTNRAAKMREMPIQYDQHQQGIWRDQFHIVRIGACAEKCVQVEAVAEMLLRRDPGDDAKVRHTGDGMPQRAIVSSLPSG
jgi:hypothetical protein